MLTPRSAAKPQLARIIRLTSDGQLAEIVASFVARYPNAKTAGDYAKTLRLLFERSGRRHPSEVTETDLISFCASDHPPTTLFTSG
jgi:hypothetical protein